MSVRTRDPARLLSLGLALTLLAAACGDGREEQRERTDEIEEAASAPAPSEWFTPAEPSQADGEERPNPEATERERDPASKPPPEWLGTRPLPRTSSGYGEVQPTPPELVDRRLWTEDILPPPPDEEFTSEVIPVPPDIAERTTWKPECPVPLEDLRYVTVAFWGFDGLPHTGEMMLHADVADDIVGVFAKLHAAKFPIEYLLLTDDVHNEQPPTGDGNVSSTFNCRPSRGSTSWSEHSKGLAVDINPFHNPYKRGDLVLPELAGAYLDRGNVRPGMIVPGDVVTKAFAEIGWHWGGNWKSSKDYMHFSADGS